jgi:hypothetical protein
MAIVTDHLPMFRDGFEDLARRAVQESLSYEQYLGELAEQECQVRRTNRIERWWGNVIVVDQGRIVPMPFPFPSLAKGGLGGVVPVRPVTWSSSALSFGEPLSRSAQRLSASLR